MDQIQWLIILFILWVISLIGMRWARRKHEASIAAQRAFVIECYDELGGILKEMEKDLSVSPGD